MALTIGRLAQASGVGVQTLRYYERRGLLSRVTRTPGGYRQFPEEEIRRIRFIRRAQGLGFTLEEIAELLTLRVERGRSCGDVEQAARLTRERVRARLADLRRMDRVLGALVESCERRQATAACPILTALDDEESAG
ncbi:MAG TPA: MerR family transcriptional regulator [Solirubrobacterales bacterium]|nr:MerR family transcriptional regulator [Solirubrobacterales bacterium]